MTISDGHAHAVATVNGENVDDLLSPHVSIAWGSWVVLAASIALLVSAWLLREPTAGLQPISS